MENHLFQDTINLCSTPLTKQKKVKRFYEVHNGTVIVIALFPYVMEMTETI